MLLGLQKYSLFIIFYAVNLLTLVNEMSIPPKSELVFSFVTSLKNQLSSVCVLLYPPLPSKLPLLPYTLYC